MPQRFDAGSSSNSRGSLFDGHLALRGNGRFVDQSTAANYVCEQACPDGACQNENGFAWCQLERSEVNALAATSFEPKVVVARRNERARGLP